MTTMPVFNSTRSTEPRLNLDPGALGWALAHDPILRQRTEAVRSAADPGPHKLRLPGTCLGGPFRGLPAGDDHGRTTRQHNRHQCSGYRNSLHADWGARTGLVLIDIDDLERGASPDAVKFLLTHGAEPVAIAWTSARGRGLKIGVVTTPIPATADETRWAWESARDYMVDFLKSAGLQEGFDFKVDRTDSVPQLAILAHDTRPLVRVPDPMSAVVWTPGEPAPRGLTTTTGAILFRSPNVDALVAQLSWDAGGRSASMHRLGVACAMSGVQFELARVSAEAVAHSSGLVKDYGRYNALRHFDRGYFWGAEQLWDSGL